MKGVKLIIDARLSFCVWAVFQRDIEKHILLRGMFAKPTTTETYCYFFETLFAEHGFPGSLGLVVDFDTTQILGIIHAYYRVKYKGKEDQLNKFLRLIKSNDATTILRPLRYVRGCQFHAKRSFNDSCQAILSKSNFRRGSLAWNEMMSTTKADDYRNSDAILMDLARSNRCFATFLQWWRDSLSGARFFILQSINL